MRQATSQIVALVLSVSVGACAPAYRPPTPFVPLLQEQGDAHLGLHLGTGGAQLDGAYAVTPSFALRTGVQVAGYTSDGAYTVGTLGAGFYGASENLAWGVTLVGGGGYSRGITKVTVTTTTTGGDENSSESTWRNSGLLATGALRAELGSHLGENGAVGGTLGPTWHMLSHDSESDGTGTGQMAMIELAGVARGGSPTVQFEGSLGLAYPLWISEQDEDVLEVGIPVPIVIGLGVTFDL
jgi:hypothetical protein